MARMNREQELGRAKPVSGIPGQISQESKPKSRRDFVNHL
jgi:hypothetical protein